MTRPNLLMFRCACASVQPDRLLVLRCMDNIGATHSSSEHENSDQTARICRLIRLPLSYMSKGPFSCDAVKMYKDPDQNVTISIWKWYLKKKEEIRGFLSSYFMQLESRYLLHGLHILCVFFLYFFLRTVSLVGLFTWFSDRGFSGTHYYYYFHWYEWYEYQ